MEEFMKIESHPGDHISVSGPTSLPLMPVIFIVDDDVGTRLAIRALLEGEGYELVFFENGSSILQALNSRQPDAILLDVMMPDINGFQVCSQIRHNPDLEGIPVIMITSLDAQDYKVRAIEHGVDDFLNKPFNKYELRARLKMVTKLNRYRRLVMAEKRLEWVIKDAQDGYIIVDEYGQIRYANRKASQLLGQGDSLPTYPTNFFGLIKTDFVATPEIDWEHWPCNYLEQEHPQYLVRSETQYGHATWLQMEMIDNPNTGQNTYLLRLKDVSAQMQREFEMFSFHAAINHKLRTPLGQMIGGLELLHLNMNELSDENRELSRWALNGARLLSKQIQEILTFANIPTVRGIEEGTQLSWVSESLSEMFATLEIERARVSIPPGLEELKLVLSKQALEVILWELLENAIKFHPEHRPTVNINVQKPSPRAVSLEVISTGTSLPENVLHRVWEPYFQNEKIYSGQVPGIGLGLSVVAKIILQSGGKYAMWNLPNKKGVKVILEVPISTH